MWYCNPSSHAEVTGNISSPHILYSYPGRVLVSEPDPRKIEKEGLAHRLGWKCRSVKARTTLPGTRVRGVRHPNPLQFRLLELLIWQPPSEPWSMSPWRSTAPHQSSPEVSKPHTACGTAIPLRMLR